MLHYFCSLILISLSNCLWFCHCHFFYSLFDFNRNFPETSIKYFIFVVSSKYWLLSDLFSGLNFMLFIFIATLYLFRPLNLLNIPFSYLLNHFKSEILWSLLLLLLLLHPLFIFPMSLPQHLIPLMIIPVLLLNLEQPLQPRDVLHSFKPVCIRVL